MDESSKNYPNEVGATKPLNKRKREPEEDDLETKVILKKQKKHREKSRKKKKKKKKGKRSCAMKTHVKAAPNSQRSSDNSSSNDEADPTKKRAETDGSVQTKAESSSSEVQACCFDTEDAEGNNEKTIFVKGFDSSLRRDDIKSALTKHFGPCGEITRVFVPIQCDTGVSLGYAFINFKQGPRKALKLNKSDMGGWKLKVKRAIRRDEYYGFVGRKGCERCRFRNTFRNSHYRGVLGPCCEAMFYR